jgi:diguanylate cyclase (GGDEF)-like protein/PAS domain S-box-containing protein
MVIHSALIHSNSDLLKSIQLSARTHKYRAFTIPQPLHITNKNMVQARNNLDPVESHAADDEDDAVTPVSAEHSRGFFGKLSGRISSQKPVSAPSIKTKEALLLLQNYEESRQGWFWSTDTQGCITYITDSVAQVLGKNAADLIGSRFLDLFFPQKGDSVSQRTLPFILTKQTKFEELPLHAAVLGTERWWSVSGRPQFDAAGNFTGYRGSGIDITAQRRNEEDTSKLAKYDSLTGLLNRHFMAKTLETTLTAFANQQRSCGVMLIDLDRFKQVNDTLGHPAGDALLKQVAERLLKIIDDTEKVSRLGGDEFQIILPDTDDRGAIGDLATRIINSLSQPYSVEGSRCIIGASIGIAISPFDGFTTEDIIRNADLALYAAKGNGRGRFRFYSNDLLQSAEDRRVLEDDLRDALTKGELSLSYQPVVQANSNIVTGFEALIRWTHPERGAISPGLFIPIAEEANLIGPLGEWALRQACSDAAKWPGKLRVAVNVSPIQFANEGLPKIVLNALASSGLAPDRLELEITEGVFMGDTAVTDAMFKAMKKIGVRLALDDFGTGYSSLSYLQTAPFDKIKIDQSFVRGATEPGSRNGAIIAAIVALADALEMETTAEGIETLDQLALIGDLNVSHVQGYVYSKAVPNDELCKHIELGNWEIIPTGPAKQRNDRHSVFRKVRLIHDNHFYSVVVRNLSATGALIEGLMDVPVKTRFVIDFGEGQLAVATVRRSNKHQQGIEFEQRLVSDGNGGLCTAHRVSPYLIAAAGMPVDQIPSEYRPAVEHDNRPMTLPAFNSVSDWKSAS